MITAHWSRHVGNALKSLPPNSDIPWQVRPLLPFRQQVNVSLTSDSKRVISSKGLISPRGDLGQGVARQKDRLEQEGVEVVTLAGAGGEKVDLRRWGWFPEEVDLEQ